VNSVYSVVKNILGYFALGKKIGRGLGSPALQNYEDVRKTVLLS
jgi:hypothetical protein